MVLNLKNNEKENNTYTKIYNAEKLEDKEIAIHIIEHKNNIIADNEEKSLPISIQKNQGNKKVGITIITIIVNEVKNQTNNNIDSCLSLINKKYNDLEEIVGHFKILFCIIINDSADGIFLISENAANCTCSYFISLIYIIGERI